MATYFEVRVPDDLYDDFVNTLVRWGVDILEEYPDGEN